MDWDDRDDDDMSGVLAFFFLSIAVCIWVWAGGGLLVERIAVFASQTELAVFLLFFARCFQKQGAILLAVHWMGRTG
jgi:hypothetical protein